MGHKRNYKFTKKDLYEAFKSMPIEHVIYVTPKLGELINKAADDYIRKEYLKEK